MTERPILLSCIALALAGGLGQAHALDETPLSMVYDPAAAPAQAQAPLPDLTGCRLELGAIRDVRPNKQSVGAYMPVAESIASSVPLVAAPIFSGDGEGWLQGALAPLRAHGLRTAADPAAPSAIQVGLRLAHAWTGVQLGSHVVVQASFPGATGAVTRRYHGFGSKLNMMNGNAEFMAVLNEGMRDAVRRFSIDLDRACRGEAIGP